MSDLSYMTDQRMDDRATLASLRGLLGGREPASWVPQHLQHLVGEVLAEVNARLATPLYPPAPVAPIPTAHLRHLVDGEPLNSSPTKKGAGAEQFASEK